MPHPFSDVLAPNQVIEAADVVLEVLDARDPLGCRCPQVEQAVVQSGSHKKIVLVLNKIGDLCSWFYLMCRHVCEMIPARLYV